MRISTKGRYSLVATLYLSLLGQGEYVTGRSIADATGISEGYLEQLFITLRREGILQGVRGPQGGYCLGRPPSEISAGAVLRAVEGSLSPTECVADGDVCPKGNSCTSRQAWCSINVCIQEFIDSITLADLVKDYNLEPEYII
jgi:Rrf2 family protein